MSSFLLQCHTIELCRGIQFFFLSFAAQQLEIELSGEGRKEGRKSMEQRGSMDALSIETSRGD